MHEGRGVGRLMMHDPGVLVRSLTESIIALNIARLSVERGGMCNVNEELLIGKSVIPLHLVACCAGAGSGLAGQAH